MKNLGFFMSLWIAASGILVSSASAEPLRVVATLEDLASITREVGKGRVEVTALVKGNQDPHLLGAKPSLMKALSKADLLVSMGLELEVGWLPLVVRGSRNPAIQPGAPGYLESGDGIEPLELPAGEVDRSHGDVHPFGNPHYNLDPLALRVAAGNIAKRLGELDPAGKPEFEAALAAFQSKIDKAQAGWAKRLAPFAGRKIVPYHRDFSYLLHRFGFVALDHVEPRPGIAPGPKHLKGLVSSMKAEAGAVIIYQPYQDHDLVERLAAEAGSPALILPGQVLGVPEALDVFAKFEYIVSQLERALARKESR